MQHTMAPLYVSAIITLGTMLGTNIDLDNEGTLLLELNTAVAVGRGFR